MNRLLLILLAWLAVWPLAGHALQVEKADSTAQCRDSVVVSLLTCSPGRQAYELYGHTALRVRGVSGGRGDDWVFNYGTFSFKQPNFIWNFVLGGADFELSVLPYAYFYAEYAREGRGIEEQVLNLTPDEETRLVDALSDNLRPENAVYRYNIFYDNCANRAVRMIENAVAGKVHWSAKSEERTLRQIVREFADVSPWYKFGQDLLLGAEADAPADCYAQMFAPLYAGRYVADATVTNADGSVRQLALPALTQLPVAQNRVETFPLTPMWAFGMLLAATIVLMVYEAKRRKYWWQFDTLLLLLQGLTGCIVTFLFCFSSHPTVGSNWLVALFNPLPLLLFPWFMKQASRGRIYKGMYVQAVMVQAALVFGILGLQCFPVEVYLILAVLVLRLAAHFLFVTHARKP